MIRKGTIGEALDAYLDAGKKKSVLVGPLEKHMLVHSPRTPRNHRVLHPSEVSYKDWCPRWNQMVIEDRIPSPNEEVIRLRQRSIFAHGHLVHAKWQRWLADADMLWGQWVRPDGSMLWGKCPEGASTYGEVPVKNGIWQGHADGIVLTDDGPMLLEIKTVGTGTIRMGAPHLLSDDKGPRDLDRMFSDIAQPFSGHMRQVQIYLELLHRMGSQTLADNPYIRAVHPVDSAVILYECKSNQDTKEFIVKRDITWVQDRFDAADEMTGYLHSGELIPCPHDGKCKCGGND